MRTNLRKKEGQDDQKKDKRRTFGAKRRTFGKRRTKEGQKKDIWKKKDKRRTHLIPENPVNMLAC